MPKILNFKTEQTQVVLQRGQIAWLKAHKISLSNFVRDSIDILKARVGEADIPYNYLDNIKTGEGDLNGEGETGEDSFKP